MREISAPSRSHTYKTVFEPFNFSRKARCQTYRTFLTRKCLIRLTSSLLSMTSKESRNLSHKQSVLYLWQSGKNTRHAIKCRFEYLTLKWKFQSNPDVFIAIAITIVALGSDWSIGIYCYFSIGGHLFSNRRCLPMCKIRLEWFPSSSSNRLRHE